MLWALIRLSVRDAGSQLRYRRPPRRRSGLTRSDGAGTGSRARPEPGCDLTPFQDRNGRIPSANPRKPGSGKRYGPGLGPGPSAWLLPDQKSMSPPPPGAAGALSFSGFSAITASVVRNRPAIDAAFCSAERVTFAGSMIPALNMSTYSPFEASRPWPLARVLTFSTT